MFIGNKIKYLTIYKGHFMQSADQTWPNPLMMLEKGIVFDGKIYTETNLWSTTSNLERDATSIKPITTGPSEPQPRLGKPKNTPKGHSTRDIKVII